MRKFGNDKTELDGLIHGIVGYGGVRVNLNVWYPVQLTLGADYNYTYLISGKDDNRADVLTSFHTINRLNVYFGLRIHL